MARHSIYHDFTRIYSSEIKTWILDLAADIEPGGTSATFVIQYERIGPLHVEMSYGELIRLLNRMASVSREMEARQQLTASQIEIDPRGQAVAPTSIKVEVDPASKDRIFLLNFDDRPPMAFRVPAVEFAQVLAQLNLAAANALN